MNQLGNRVEAGRATTTPTFAHPPTGRLGIHAPYAIAASADGVWFTQYSAPTLFEMRPGGEFRRVDLDPDGFPERLTVARDGAVWFTDPQGNRLGRIFPNDSKPDYFPLPMYRSGPASIVATPDGSIWFTEHAADQVAIFVAPGADRPTLGSHGIKEFSLPHGGGPAGIAAAPDGSLWFAENSGNRIGRIELASNSDEAAIAEFPLPVPHSHPNSIAVSRDGIVYFTELAASRIGMVTPQGRMAKAASGYPFRARTRSAAFARAVLPALQSTCSRFQRRRFRPSSPRARTAISTSPSRPERSPASRRRAW